MEKKKNSNVKSNKRRGKERRKEINSVVGLYVLKGKDLKDLSRGMYLCGLFSGARE